MASDARRGIADPQVLRDHLETADAAVLQMAAVRTRWMNEVQDAFTLLRSSAQLFREIFYGVELPLESPAMLIERAGGAYRIVRVSYKETGVKVFALADVVAAIPKFKSCFPIASFDKLARQLERIREDDPEAEAVWFVNDIEDTHLEDALRREAEALASGERSRSVLVQPPPRFHVCTCCGESQTPAALIASAFAAVPLTAGVGRWTGRSTGRARRSSPSRQTGAAARRGKRRRS